jgi:hypothetical protein
MRRHMHEYGRTDLVEGLALEQRLVAAVDAAVDLRDGGVVAAGSHGSSYRSIDLFVSVRVRCKVVVLAVARGAACGFVRSAICCCCI